MDWQGVITPTTIKCHFDIDKKLQIEVNSIIKGLNVLFTNKIICNAVNFMLYIIISGLNFYNKFVCKKNVSNKKKPYQTKINSSKQLLSI